MTEASIHLDKLIMALRRDVDDPWEFLGVTISGYLASTHMKDSRDVQLVLVQEMELACRSVKNLELGAQKPDASSHCECSFCGAKEPSDRLVAGPTAFICRSCAGIAVSSFKTRTL